MYGINYGQVIRGRMSAATSAAVGRAKTVSSSVAGARGRASAATRSGLGRAKSAASKVTKSKKAKIGMVGGGAAFGSYLVGGRRGRGVDKTTDRPTGMYDN